MSDYILRIIPSHPDFLPVVSSERILKEIQKFKVNAATITVKVFDHVVFVDAGENFGDMKCPVCQKELTIEWWQRSMNNAWDTKFANLISQTPCCGVRVSLNDLIYEWKIGFAKLCIDIYNPMRELTEHEYAFLEKLIGNKLNTIRCHL